MFGYRKFKWLTDCGANEMKYILNLIKIRVKILKTEPRNFFSTIHQNLGNDYREYIFVNVRPYNFI